MAPEIDPQVLFKNLLVASVLLGLVAGAALAFRPGSVNTVGQGGGGYSSSWGGGGSWDGGDHDDDDD